MHDQSGPTYYTRDSGEDVQVVPWNYILVAPQNPIQANSNFLSWARSRPGDARASRADVAAEVRPENSGHWRDSKIQSAADIGMRSKLPMG